MLAASAWTAAQRRQEPIRVVVLAANASADALAGIRFAATEAGYTARLLKRDFQLIETSRSEQGMSAAAFIVTEPLELDLAGVTLSVSRRDRSSRHFRVLPDCQGLAWVDGLEKYGAAQLNDRYRAATGRQMTEAAWAGWIAVKILLEAALRAAGTPLSEYLTTERAFFDGHKGKPLRFGADRVLQQPMYVLESGRVRELDWADLSCS